MVLGVRRQADLRANRPGTGALATTTEVNGQMKHAPTATPRLRGKTRPAAWLSRAGAQQARQWQLNPRRRSAGLMQECGLYSLPAEDAAA